MNSNRSLHVAGLAILAVSVAAGLTLGNGGPFVIKYPGGDVAAKGVLARLDDDLRPAREERLCVVREDLTIEFGRDRFFEAGGSDTPPLVSVAAAYTIENPTDREVKVDFGFPILRGIHINPASMMPTPDVTVDVGTQRVRPTIISNSAIYGIIRQKARAAIGKALAGNAEVGKRVEAVQSAQGAERQAAKKNLVEYLTSDKKWSQRDAALLAEYAWLDLGNPRSSRPFDGANLWYGESGQMADLYRSNLGPLAAIGEQKATQFLAQLAGCLESGAAAAYEKIFTAWGGEVKERSVDLRTGRVRPREIEVPAKPASGSPRGMTHDDPTLYARVDYLDESAKISDEEKAACRAILKNLPVVFTFAPMNLLHYEATFPAKATQTIVVRYSQYAYSDTAAPASYQLAYVVHPASLWKEFGPIRLEVHVPQGVTMRASVPLRRVQAMAAAEAAPLLPAQANPAAAEVAAALRLTVTPPPFDTYYATLREKTGELFVAVDAESWREAAGTAGKTSKVSAVAPPGRGK